jgi:hypothetical protein
VRKILSIFLIGFGAFGLCLAIGLRFWAVPRAEKVPLDVDVRLVATGDGQILNGTTGDLEPVSLRATQWLRTDSAASDATVSVTEERLCVVRVIDNPPDCVKSDDKLNRLLSVTTDRFGAHRTTGESVNTPKYRESIDGDTAAKHIGLTYQWPFHSEKKSYQYFDPNIRLAAEAKYIGNEKLEGLNLYKYEAVQPAIAHDLAPGFPGTYADTRTVWVHPLTGTIVKSVDKQTLALANGDIAAETTLIADGPTVKLLAGMAKDGAAQLGLLGMTLPIGAAVLGVLVLIFGLRLGRGRPSAPVQSDSPPSDETGSSDVGEPNDLQLHSVLGGRSYDSISLMNIDVPGKIAPRSGDH